MSLITEVSDALKAVSQTVKSLQTLSDAISKGKDYLKTQHPEVATDLAALCEEMKKSAQALAAASSLITHFRFVIAEDALAREASRFNEHLVAHKTKAEHVRQQLDSMRGHCHIIRQHAEAIEQNAKPKGIKSLAALFGLHSAEKEQELARALEEIYNEEMQYHLGVNDMAEAIQIALQDVQDQLGPAGSIAPDQVPQAAERLGTHAEAFARLESQCNHMVYELQATIDTLKHAP